MALLSIIAPSHNSDIVINNTINNWPEQPVKEQSLADAENGPKPKELGFEDWLACYKLGPCGLDGRSYYWPGGSKKFDAVPLSISVRMRA